MSGFEEYSNGGSLSASFSWGGADMTRSARAAAANALFGTCATSVCSFAYVPLPRAGFCDVKWAMKDELE